jgi:hypothetical protein
MELQDFVRTVSVALLCLAVCGFIVSGSINGNNDNATVNKPITTPTTTETPTEETTPEAVQTALVIDTYPEGATVVMDGNNIGETPIKIECGPGEYELRLHLDGYEDIPPEMVTAEEGKETQLEYTLNEEAGTNEDIPDEDVQDEPTEETQIDEPPIEEETPICTPTPTECYEGAIPTTLKSLPLDKVVSQKSVKCLEFDTYKKCSIVTINGKEFYLVEK